jgi:flagellar M-ring protein FliF
VTTYLNKWNALAARAKFGLAAGAALILALTVVLAIWIYRPSYQVLFAELAPGDAAAMTAELERMKVPFQLADGGNTILVPKDAVYKTRLKLMGNDIPLRGAVGFEVFNNADFGMTEFVQKVNYQRAIQGELTRTIMAIENIQSARVHLAVPEQGLFKKATTKPKASVTVTMKPRKSLTPEQTAGIQRLVAASVPDITAADVTILDQHGVALTRVAQGETGLEAAGTQLDSKKSAEEYLLRKVTQVLDRTFGAGEAIASVDLVLNLDQSRVTTEDVMPSKAANDSGVPIGVVVRERQTVKDAGSAASARDAQSSTVTASEADYQVGRRVEQVVSAPGATRRMTIAVVVKKPLTASQVENLKEVVASAAGFNSARGDTIAVYSMDKIVESGTPGTVPAAVPGVGDAPPPVAETAAGDLRAPMAGRLSLWIAAVAAVALGIGATLAVRASRRSAPIAPPALAHDRDEVLHNVRRWLQDGHAAEAGEGVPR